MTSSLNGLGDRARAAAVAGGVSGVNGAAAAPPLLAVSGLTVRYLTRRGPVQAVTDANFVLARGEAVAVIGESGSGKSTLAQALVGLLPAAAQVVSGAAAFTSRDGAPEVDLLALRGERLRVLRWAQVAYVSQGAINAFNPLLTIGQHFRDTAAAHGQDPRPLGERSTELLHQVRLEPRRILRSYPHQLSGGTKQRALIALAMLLEPALLVLDEPTTALDVITQRVVLDIINDLRTRTGVGVLFVSHDLDIAADVTDRILTMYAGRVVEDSPVEELIAAPLHPYSEGLLRAAPLLTEDEPVVAVRGNPPDLVALPPGCPFHPRCPAAGSLCRTDPPPPLAPVRPSRRAACHLRTGGTEPAAAPRPAEESAW